MNTMLATATGGAVVMMVGAMIVGYSIYLRRHESALRRLGESYLRSTGLAWRARKDPTLLGEYVWWSRGILRLALIFGVLLCALGLVALIVGFLH